MWWNRPANELLKEHENDELCEDETPECEIVDESDDVISIPEAQEFINKMRKLALKTGRTSLLNKVMDVDDELLEMMSCESKQTTISDFFKPL